jgi:hypothetical protein
MEAVSGSVDCGCGRHGGSRATPGSGVAMPPNRGGLPATYETVLRSKYCARIGK